MRAVLAIVLIALTAGAGAAERSWVNNITVGEYNMTWNYTETFTGMGSVIYRIGIDTELGDNDSFINAWELLKADKEMRKMLRSSIDKEPDVRINNVTGGISVIDIESALSPSIIGKTHSFDPVVNRYEVAYRWKESILNGRTIWFLGQAKSPVKVVLPSGIDVTNTNGMVNITENISNHTEISGFFNEVSPNRGEITLYLAKNISVVSQPHEINVTNVTSYGKETAKPMNEILSKIRDVSILVAAVVIILLIYVFKIRKR